MKTMTLDDLWELYQRARSKRAKAEIALIEARQKLVTAEAGYDGAMSAELAAGSAWRATYDAGRKAEAKEEGPMQ